MSVVLVVNSGSSSIKYQIIEMDTEDVLGKGLMERIGLGNGLITHLGPEGEQTSEHLIPDRVAGFRAMIDACNAYGPKLDDVPIVAVGHRVVQGGSRFVAPTVIDSAMIQTIEEISPLAPLHNPPNLLGIAAERETFPDLPHVAIFDTPFHQTMPQEAYTYAIDANIANACKVRKYGFHGTSHKYVSELAAAYLQMPLGDLNTISLHIGNGASACAVRGGIAIDTSMGMTPLEGLVRGTRSGDIDPGTLFHLHRHAGMTIDQLDDMLNRRSGLPGMAASSDMRDVLDSAHQVDQRARLALNVYCYRLRSYVGTYYAQLGKVDAIVFTAGVGEHAPEVRAQTLSGLEHMGIRLDDARNASSDRGIRSISSDDSPVAVLVIPTNEELEIARQTLDAIARDTNDAKGERGR